MAMLEWNAPRATRTQKYRAPPCFCMANVARPDRKAARSGEIKLPKETGAAVLTASPGASS
jgi:hypothetical protein